jgi:exosortase
MEQGDKGRRGDEKAIQTEVEERRSEEGNSSRRGDEETRSQVGVDIHETARIVGPVMICEGAVVEKDAIIVGPAVIGPNVHIGRGAVVSESVLWEGSSVGQASVVTQCLLTCGAHAAGSQMLTERLLTAKHTVRAEKAKTPLPATSKEPPPKKTLAMMTDRFRRRLPLAGLEALLSRPSATWVGAAILLACFFLTYWEPTIKDLWRIWMRSDEFSSGLLVPFLACYVLGSQRHRLSNCTIRPCLWGIVAFAGAQTMRFFGLWLMYSSAERLSIVMTVIAVILLVFGWRLVLRIWPVLLYLFFMLPLPGRVQTWITQPLQRWATHSAVFGLETLGYNVAREGNIINMNGVRVEVAQACNGLRMLTAFFVIAGLVALLVQRRWWEKLIIIASSIPIAFACNTLRLIITSIAFTVVSVEQWEKAFHDFGGLAMMPLALALIVAELWLLSHLIVEHTPVPVNVNLTSEGVSSVVYGKDRK